MLVLTLFTLLNMKRKLIVGNKFYFHSALFTIALSLTWLATLFFHSVWAENYKIIFEGLYSATFGCSAGLIAYLHIRFTKTVNPKMETSLNKQKKSREFNEQILSLVMIANRELKKVNNELRQQIGETETDVYSYETQLNEILDKINERGEDSLTELERQFLQDYSKQI